MMNKFQNALQQLEEQHRLRSLKLPAGIDLTSNDYLGLRAHPQLRVAAIEAIEGGIDLGAGGSRLLRGHTQHHENLEIFAAEYFGAEKALYFSNGYQANLAIFTALPARGDTIIFDDYIHASARDGIQASHARHVRVKHNDLQAFEDALKSASGQKWIAVESVYSMDGDLAPLKELQALAARYDAFLIVDEAHGTGVFGANGKGLSECLISPSSSIPLPLGRGKASVSEQGEGTQLENLITLHTCGKALGVAGGLVCGPAVMIDMLVNTARPFIYSTAPPPLQALLVHKALEIVQEEPQRREKLFRLMALANQWLPVKDSPSQIVPIILGDDARTMEVAADLQRAGFDIRAIRPPTVPEGTARLRLSLNVNLDEKILRDFAEALLPHLQRRAA